MLVQRFAQMVLIGIGVCLAAGAFAGVVSWLIMLWLRRRRCCADRLAALRERPHRRVHGVGSERVRCRTDRAGDVPQEG